MRLGNFFALDSLEREHRLGLREQFVHCLLAGAGHRLIGRDHDALDPGLVMQRLQRHHELRGRAVRIGDDALLAEARDRVGIHLRHDQRHVGSMRQAEELSITTAPCAAIFGDHSFDTAPPADIRQISTSEKS